MPTTKKDVEKISKLGNKSSAERKLEVFPNHAPKGLVVVLDCREFTCRCPVTNQPDYATILIEYVPGKWVVESKSFKLYLETFREVGVFHEHLAVDIANDFVKFIKPKSVKVTVNFNVRGGIAISATYTVGKK